MSALLEKMLDGFFQNPINPREAILTDRSGEPLGGVTLHHMDERSWGKNHLHLEEVRALSPGGGRLVMEILIDRADALCATISGTVKSLPAYAYNMKKMPQRKLVNWYKQFGFKTERDTDITRYPDPSRCGMVGSP